ncbi:SDR family oxidoreductase [Streptomyces sp. ME19-01-6]|uniref:SDR family NAD(P)-dependent oxidoreductase n=1 Tax=Streptomyces sp. ME19-01-6 TaxID=3028686 RepID=UPI0029A5ACF6|nr:SDR family oxidoreductase [Streptomyces sp. ME19-01-6]MDX3231498.1 SDR family NAD(P)-dependent oxidoreductase [Streptomyces sp. ME19-01-6]
MPRTVLITGGTSGIGLAAAARFAADGADVTVTGRRQETVERAAKELGVHGVVCDATEPRQIEALTARLGDTRGTLDVLVNAAGGLPRAATDDGSPLDEVRAQWEANWAQNLMTAVLTTTAVRERMAPGGTVTSIGSIGAERGGGGYGAAKAALAAWNAFLSAELGPHGVTANVISAGYVENTNFFGDRLTRERHDALVAETHNKRPGTPQDIAETVFFLASPGARHITGQTIHVNGGAYTTR